MLKVSKISKGILFMLVFALSLSLVACGGSSTPEPEGEETGGSEASRTIFLNIATSTTGGSMYPIGGKLADMITKNIEGVQATAEATAGGVENVRLLAAGEADIATMPSDTLHNGVNGVREFEGEGQYDIAQIAALHRTPLQLVALKESGIETVADLKGKKVSLGAPGSATAVRAEVVLNAYGLTLDDITEDHTTSGEAATQLGDGQIDAAFFSAGAPSSAVMDISSRKEIRLISLDEDVAAAIVEEHPYLFAQTLPAGVYPGVEEDVICLGNTTTLVCRPDLSEDLVYEITKMMFEQKDDFITAHNVLVKEFALEDALAVQHLSPVHPGALKYYKEVGLVD